jgi:gliding-associated putative ABC transporter substrate-binding component GldG
MAENTKKGSSGGAGGGARPMSKAGRQRAESLGFLAIIAAILVSLNVLGVFFFYRLDTTENRAFTLSEGSRRVVRELEDTMTITAYFTEDLPPPLNATERHVRDILAEYEAASRGHVRVRFVAPDEDEEREEAERMGVQLVQHQRLESDRVSVVEGYRGIVFEYLGDHQTIAAIPADTAGLEYSITTTIKQLVGDDLPIGVLSGHESPTPTKGLGTLQRMLPTYTIREVDAANEIDRELRALLIVDPQSALSETELRHIDQFVMRGGSLGVFGGSMKVSLESQPDITAEPSESGLNRLLERWGVTMDESIVADQQCEQLPLRTQMGFAIPVPYPPAPRVTFTEEEQHHPALFRLPETQLFFVSPLATTETFRNLEGTVLMRSSEQSWELEGETISLRIRNPREWVSTMGGTNGPFALAVALEGELPSAFSEEGGTSSAEGGDSDSQSPTDRGDQAAGDSSIEAPDRSEREVRVLVVGSGSMLHDEFLGGGQADTARLAGIMAFTLNAIDWLAQDSDLIAIRAKTIEDPELAVPRGVDAAEDDVRQAVESQDEEGVREALERRTEALRAWESRKNWYRWGNTLLIPIAFAAFGIFRWQWRQRKKATLKI